MNSKYNVFIRKNTPYLVEKLIELGYRRSLFFYPSDGVIVAHKNGKISSYVNLPLKYIYTRKMVDSFEKEELFLALAAILDISDKNVYFKFNRDYTDELNSFKEGDVFKCLTETNPYREYTRRMEYDELVEYFKNKK